MNNLHLHSGRLADSFFVQSGSQRVRLQKKVKQHTIHIAECEQYSQNQVPSQPTIAGSTHVPRTQQRQLG